MIAENDNSITEALIVVVVVDDSNSSSRSCTSRSNSNRKEKENHEQQNPHNTKKKKIKPPPRPTYLISKQNRRDGRAVRKGDFRVQVRLPLGHGVESLGSSHVENNEGSHGLLVVHPSHVSKALLAWSAWKGVFF